MFSPGNGVERIRMANLRISNHEGNVKKKKGSIKIEGENSVNNQKPKEIVIDMVSF